MDSKNFYFLCFLLAISFFQMSSLEESNSSNEYVTSFEEFQELVNSPEFIDYIQEKELDDLLLKGDDEKQCLMDENKAVDVLNNSYGVTDNPSPDENLRFILGKCNPVLLVPGIYSTKLVVELQCKNIATEEKSTTLKNIRLFCGDTLCKDETQDYEEHYLFIGLFDKAFSILGADNDKYSACLGFIMNYFQNPNECPVVNNKNLCNYSKYIKVGFYGSSTDKLKDSRCGVEGVQNVIQTGTLFYDEFLNAFTGSGCFYSISETLIKRGYKEGFSFGAIPNDYRRYLATNNFATKVFESQINRLYLNTGKPVVIVAHSYGTLLTLTNLIKKKGNTNFLSKIKKFIAIAPPFAGATKLLDAFLHGLHEWDKEVDFFGKKIQITDYNIFGQLFMYKTLPTITELRPLSIAAKIFTDSKYSELGEAIKARIDTERKCKSTDCSADTLKTETAKFDSIFKDYYPSLTDKECAYESSISGNPDTYSRKCYTNMYNVGDCPTLITQSMNPTQEGLNEDAYCGKTGPNYYYQGDCTPDRNCLDDIYPATNKCPYVFKNTEAVNYLLNRFNDNFSSKFGRIDSSYFDSYDEIRDGVKASIKFQDDSSLIKDLPLPPVDTDVVYASFAPTTNMVVVNDDDFSIDGDVLNKGGDGTVPSWSSLLTGFKWIYEMKKDSSYKNKIRLIEYCSRLAYDGNYKYDPSSEQEQTFAALGCRCLSINEYKYAISPCSHAGMLNDDALIEYINSIIDNPKESATVTDSKKIAVTSYNSNIKYEEVCSKDLKTILETAK